MEMFLLQMGQRIANRRKILNYTQATLAEAIGVTTQTISSAECGKKALRPENIVKLSVALNCTTDYILCGKSLAAIPDNLAATYEKLSPLQFQCLVRIVENYLTAVTSNND